jgi:endonuclease G
MKWKVLMGLVIVTNSILAQNSKEKLEIPQHDSLHKVIQHVGYSLIYNESYEQPSWVAYELTKDETVAQFERTNHFMEDPQIGSGTATDQDYLKSGYDRGHLAPAGDLAWSATAMKESFYYSNMSPQLPGFNRGIWKKLETQVRSWAIENESVLIVTGPVLTKGLPTIGPNKVAVPNYFFKVILDAKKPSRKAIGFIIPNSSSKEKLQRFAVSVDSVEAFTGFNFFPNLEDSDESTLEKQCCVACWNWELVSSESNPSGVNTKSKAVSNKKEGVPKRSVSVQCSGTTKAGNRCKNKTLNPSGRCYLHE